MTESGACVELHVTMLTLSLRLILNIQPYPNPSDPNHKP